MLVTNVHSGNPERNAMEHLLEWHLIYRDEGQLESVLPAPVPRTGFIRTKPASTCLPNFASAWGV